MTTKIKLSPEHVNIIVSHNLAMQSAAVNAVVKLRSLPPEMHTAKTLGDIKYWESVACGLKWANAIARQRQITEETDDGTTV